MNFLVDLCVEADGFMFRELIKQLVQRGHRVLVTARGKVGAMSVHEWAGLKPVSIGEYGYSLEGKLLASAKRIQSLAEYVIGTLGNRSLDAVVSNCSVEASRVGFGLGAAVHSFLDRVEWESRHQNRLVIPLCDYIYAPWLIEKNFFHRFGFCGKKIVSYRGFLGLSWLPQITVDDEVVSKLGLDPNRKIVVFRESEISAAYLFGSQDITLPAIQKLAPELPDIQFVARPRYDAESLKKWFQPDHLWPNVRIFEEPIDLQSLVAKADLFVGGGGTMSLEAAYFGTPVVNCHPLPQTITDFLRDEGLSWDAKTVEEAIALTRTHLVEAPKKGALNNHEVFSSLRFPFEELILNLEMG